MSPPRFDDFRDGMPNSRPCSFDVLLRQPRRDADLERRLQVPASLLGWSVLTLRHPFLSCYQYPIGKYLPIVLVIFQW